MLRYGVAMVSLSFASWGAACIGTIGSAADDDAAGAGASSPSGSSSAGQGGSGSGGAGQGGSGSGSGGAGQGSSGSGSAGQGGSGSGSGGAGQGGAGQGGAGQGGGVSDPYAAARTACINKINALRATKSAPALSQWTGAEMCADDQATSDQQTNNAHGAFGMCGEMGQNECLGGGAANIESCLQNMWNEKDQAGCAGCDACAGAYNPNCPNCDFYGDQTGDVCGHYVNMRALYFDEAACGFSASGGWAVIDFR